jgi:hypothetical protein
MLVFAYLATWGFERTREASETSLRVIRPREARPDDRLAKQSRATHAILDCFVALLLAMTLFEG